MALKTSHKVGVTAGAVVLCCSMVAPYEGLWLTAKPDKLAYNIPTVCYGETEGVKLGDTYTKAQCDEKLRKKLPRYLGSAASCITVPVSERTLAAYGSLTYNIGEKAFCHSTVVKKLNAGDPFGSCDAMLAWSHSGGKFVQGLYNRRVKERADCLRGINDIKLPSAPAAPELPKSAVAPQPWYVRFWHWLMT